jgi:alkylated DNA repair dioxygenase AlkB
MAAPIQPALFELAPEAPEGFIYRDGLVSPRMEAELIERARSMPLAPFEFHGHLGHRRVASFGWRYDYARRQVEAARPIPDFLMEARQLAADFAGRTPEEFEQVLVTEYPAGAGIGWHKDKAAFGGIVGLSLASACTLHFRKAEPQGWARRAVEIAPRSAYLLKGPSRSEWEHSIAGVPHLRYSITFRTLAAAGASERAI